MEARVIFMAGTFIVDHDWIFIGSQCCLAAVLLVIVIIEIMPYY
jgi:hypothetical protein